MLARQPRMKQLLAAAGDEVVASIQQRDVGGKLAAAAELLEKQDKRLTAVEIFQKIDRSFRQDSD